MSLEHSKSVLADISDLAVKVVGLIKHHSLFDVLPKIRVLEADIRDLVAQAPEALPELKSLDPEAAGELAKSAYELVLAIMQAVAAQKE